MFVKSKLKKACFCTDVLVNKVAFGRGDSSQSIHFEGVNCNGSEARLPECHNGGIGQHDCTHDEDVAIICDVPYQGRPIV